MRHDARPATSSSQRPACVTGTAHEPPCSFLRQKRVRDIFWQAFVLAGMLGLVAFFVINASRNMRDAGIASGFDFLFRTAGIEVPFVLTGYTAQSNNLALLWVGIVNTMLITLVSAAAATVLGFLIGIARLSRNWLLSTLAGAYVEAIRNIPLLFFVLFWYFGVIAALPGPRQSIPIFDVAFLNNRGLTIPLPNYTSPFGKAALVILGALLVQIGFAWWARRRRDRTGKDAPVWTHRRAAARRHAGRGADARDPVHFVGRAGVARLQLSRRLRAGAGIRRAVRGADHLHGGIHRRDRARRHPGGAERPARGRGGGRPAPKRRSCASSSFRRRCA